MFRDSLIHSEWQYLMMIRRLYCALFAVILFMMLLISTAEEENLVELDSEQREWLEYRCSLPDGIIAVVVWDYPEKIAVNKQEKAAKHSEE